MPESNIHQFLVPGDYDAFYRLAHALSELALSYLVAIRTKAQILQRLYEMTPLGTFSDPAAAQDARDTLLHLDELAQKAVAETSRFFWPSMAFEPNFHQVNQRRWSPYDAQAWDDFFAEWGAFMAPRLQAIAALIQQLQELKELGGVATRPNKSPYSWTLDQYIPHKEHQRLEHLLTESGFQAILRPPSRESGFERGAGDDQAA